MAPFLLISAALAFGRPQGVPSVLERRGGDAPEVVVARYEDLTAVIRSLPGVTDEARARLDALEREEPGARPPLWESLEVLGRERTLDRLRCACPRPLR